MLEDHVRIPWPPRRPPAPDSDGGAKGSAGNRPRDVQAHSGAKASSGAGALHPCPNFDLLWDNTRGYAPLGLSLPFKNRLF